MEADKNEILFVATRKHALT